MQKTMRLLTSVPSIRQLIVSALVGIKKQSKSPASKQSPSTSNQQHNSEPISTSHPVPAPSTSPSAGAAGHHSAQVITTSPSIFLNPVTSASLQQFTSQPQHSSPMDISLPSSASPPVPDLPPSSLNAQVPVVSATTHAPSTSHESFNVAHKQVIVAPPTADGDLQIDHLLPAYCDETANDSS